VVPNLIPLVSGQGFISFFIARKLLISKKIGRGERIWTSDPLVPNLGARSWFC